MLYIYMSAFGSGPSNGQFWYGPYGFLYKKNVGVGGRRSTKMNPGGNITCNSSTYLYNKYKPGGGGVGASSISNRRAKNRLATVCGPNQCFPCYNTLGQYSNYTHNPNGFIPCYTPKTVKTDCNCQSYIPLQLLYSVGRGPGGGILDTNFGWDASGVWFSGNSEEEEPAYPIYTDLIIPQNNSVTITVDFVYNQNCADFGMCIYPESGTPNWNWDPDSSRIAVQYDCPNPCIIGLTNNQYSGYNLTVGNTYTCKFIYNPNSNPNIKMITLLNGTVLDTITLNDQVLSSNYRIGFCADQDNTDYRTYIKNLKINVNNCQQCYSSSLQNITVLPD